MINDPLSDLDRDELMKIIRDRLYATPDLEPIAARIGRTTSCLYAIRNGTTKWPQARTMFPLARALGLSLMLVDTPQPTRL